MPIWQKPGLDAHVAVVFEEQKKRGLVAKDFFFRRARIAADPKLAERMDRFALPWDR